MSGAGSVRLGLAVVVAVGSIGTGARDGKAASDSDCTAQATRSALSSFASAFNRGDLQRLDRLFAQPPLFGWYSSNAPGGRRTEAARNRGSLVDYFRVRHLKRDRMRLVSFTFNGNSNGFGNFVFKMKRAAGDYRRGAWFGLVGKGAAACSDDATQEPVRFVVVSVGAPGSDTR